MVDVFVGSFTIDTDAPYVANESPADAATGVSIGTNITFDVLDTGGAGIDLITLMVTVMGTPAIIAGAFQVGFSGSLTPILNGYAVVINPDVNFAFGDVVTIVVDVSDLAGPANVMPTESWTFAVFALPTMGVAPCPLEPLLPIELRLLEAFPTQALEIVRRAALDMVSTTASIRHRARGVLLTTYKNDFNAVFEDVLNVPARVLAESICRQRRLFDMEALRLPLATTLARAQQDMAALGCALQYRTTIEARTLSSSPQHRVAATCAIALMTALLLLEQGQIDATTENRFLSTGVPEPLTPVPVTIDQSISAELSIAAPLIPEEIRLRSPFGTPGLEVMRRGVLSLVTGSNELNRRIRATLLFAHMNDFLPVFTDLLTVSPGILREIIPNRRKLFAMNADLVSLESMWAVARSELRSLGVAQAYIDLLTARATSASPQHRLTAACATILLAAIADPL